MAAEYRAYNNNKNEALNGLPTVSHLRSCGMSYVDQERLRAAIVADNTELQLAQEQVLMFSSMTTTHGSAM